MNTSDETAKDRMIAIIRAQPKDATWDEIMYHLYVARKIQAGIAADEAGDIVSQEEAEKKFAGE
jgi:hypothetical protein